VGPPFVNGESAYFLSINRNKESLTLDLKNPAARGILQRLMAHADVLVENFRPGTMARLGLGYEQLAGLFPRLVYCSISGFGQTGPRRKEAGYDAVVQAEGGLMSITGAADGPPYRLGVAISDIVSGLFATQGIAFALLARQHTGKGQLVDVAMLDATAALLTYQAGIFFATGQTPGRLGNRHPTIVPYETFEASDGDFVIAVGNDEQWRRFCAVAGLDTLAADERFATNRTRVANYDVLRPLLAVRLRAETRGAWVDRLRGAGVPCGAVRDVAEVLDDPHLEARGMIQAIEHAVAGAMRVTGVPIKLSDTPGAVRTPPPLLGEHTEKILSGDAGLSADEILSLRSSGVI
jgi:crotonobetainyl-CoA:carnitine CoA-transferase CaiB-like acyl-CoA transferase